MKNNLIIFFLLIILNGCGFEPIYSIKNDSDYNIVIIENKGDKKLNNFINRELERISNKTSPNEYKIKINSKFNKIIISKDSKGSPLEFELLANIDFVIISDNFNKSISFKENKICRKYLICFNKQIMKILLKKTLLHQL